MYEERIEDLETRVLELERELAGLRDGRRRESRGAQMRPAVPASVVPSTPLGQERPQDPAPSMRTQAYRSHQRSLTLEDVLSPRNLAIAGAIAVLAGLVFLVSYGISNGWISEEVRVLGAATFATLLACAGVFFREVKKLAAPAETLVVLGLAGLFVSLVAATRLYDLVDPVTALAFSGLIGAAGLAIGLWWRSEVIATSILAGALLAPLMVGADYSPGLLAFLIPVFMAAVAAAISRDWPAVFPVTALLFLASLIASVADAGQGSTLAAFGLSLITLLLVVAGSVGRSLLTRKASVEREVLLYGFFFSAVTILGTIMVTGSEQPLFECVNEGTDCSGSLTTAGSLWLLTSAALSAGIWWLARERGEQTLSVTAFALGAGALAAALGFIFEGGPLLTAAWSAEAACLIGFGISQWQRLVGVAALGLALICALIEVPMSVLGEGSGELLRDLGATAPLLVPLALLAWRERNELGEIGAGLGVGVAAWMGVIMVGSLSDPQSILMLVPLGLAATVPACMIDRVWSRATLIVFGSSAVVFVIANQIPWDALVNGVPSAPEAAAVAAMLIVCAAAVAVAGPRDWRAAAAWTAVGICIYTVSVLVVDGFQGGVEVDGELSTDAQGQVIVSSLWALSGLGLVVAGLLRQHLSWRKAGLIMLILACAKISFYDLASLNTAGRTISFILVGLVLLAAAFAYQWMNRRAEADPAN